MLEIEMGARPASQGWSPAQRRAIGIVVALILELLLLLALLTLGTFTAHKKEQPPLTMIQSWSDHPNPKHVAAHQTAAAAKTVNLPPPLKHIPPPISPKVPTPAPILEISKEDFAASDISKFGSKASASGNGKGSGPSYGPGEGPGGAQLYNAEWYREPSPGEMAAYLPNGAPPNSWATIACQTVPHYHVENCEALDESPPGCGLKPALRRAAWQFLVRPPMLDGKPLMGKWVKIRFYWTAREEK